MENKKGFTTFEFLGPLLVGFMTAAFMAPITKLFFNKVSIPAWQYTTDKAVTSVLYIATPFIGLIGAEIVDELKQDKHFKQHAKRLLNGLKTRDDFLKLADFITAITPDIDHSSKDYEFLNRLDCNLRAQNKPNLKDLQKLLKDYRMLPERWITRDEDAKSPGKIKSAAASLVEFRKEYKITTAPKNEKFFGIAGGITALSAGLITLANFGVSRLYDKKPVHQEPYPREVTKAQKPAPYVAPNIIRRDDWVARTAFKEPEIKEVANTR